MTPLIKSWLISGGFFVAVAIAGIIVKVCEAKPGMTAACKSSERKAAREGRS